MSAGASKDGNSEGAYSQADQAADLAHSPSLNAVRGRRNTARMDPRNYTNVRRQLYNTDSDKASNNLREVQVCLEKTND